MLRQNSWFENSLHVLRDKNIHSRIQKLVSGLDRQSTDLVYRLVSRTLEVSQSRLKAISLLTTEELQALERIHNEFYPNIAQITPDLFYYNGYLLPKRPGIEVLWDKHGLYKFKTLDKIKNKDIIDVGGYIGDSALIFQEYTDKNVYSFEATQTNYNLMLKTIELNNAQRIVPVKKALGSTFDTMKISLSGGTSSFVLDGGKCEEAVIITLDSYVKEHNIQVGFIKVDIEGFEMEFLKGAKETICSQKPALLISIYHNIEHFLEIKPLIESWNLGYSFQIHKPIDESISVETGLICEVLKS